jgi:hypothetical protein
MVQELNKKKYWFDEKNLLKPIDWAYINTFSRVQDALELYMRGDISIGRAAAIARLTYREFDRIRAKARIPIHH